MRLLIADDHDVMRENIISFVSRQPDIEVIGEAKDGETAVELARKFSPDIVLMDINMPKLNGKTLVLQTNEIKEERPFLTIVMTARISPDEQQWVDEMIDTQLMQKPFSPKKMLSCVDQYFGKS